MTFARKTVLSPARRATAIVAMTALALTAVAPSVASAAPRAAGASKATSGATDFSARRRGHGHGGAAAAAAFAGIVGAGLAIAAAQNRRAYYDEYYGRPVYGAPAPGYYYGAPGYGPYRNDSALPYVDSRPYGW